MANLLRITHHLVARAEQMVDIASSRHVAIASARALV